MTLGGAEQRCRVGAASSRQEEGARAEGICLPVNKVENSQPAIQRSVLILIVSDSLPSLLRDSWILNSPFD